MSIIEKSKTVFWFLKRPDFYPFLLALAKRRLLNKDDNLNKEQAIEYCKEHCISSTELYRKLGIQYADHQFTVSHEKIILEAKSKIKALDVVLGGAGALELLYLIILSKKPERVIETGVAYGWSSLAILAALDLNKKGNLVSVDMPYPKMDVEDYVGIVVPENFRNRWTLIRRPDRNGILKALSKFDNEIDLCHYDSDKSYTGRKWANHILWKHLAEGGVFISDDIQDNIAFVEFCEEVNRKPYIIFCDEKYVGLIIK